MLGRLLQRTGPLPTPPAPVDGAVDNSALTDVGLMSSLEALFFSSCGEQLIESIFPYLLPQFCRTFNRTLSVAPAVYSALQVLGDGQVNNRPL